MENRKTGKLASLILIALLLFQISLISAFSCTCTSNDGVGGDWNPEGYRITSEAITEITGKHAIITWTTDEPATSQIEYGITTEYGSYSGDNAKLTTEHQVLLTGLTPDTTYHFRVISELALFTLSSDDATFTTLAEPVTLEVGVLALPTSNNPLKSLIGDANRAHIAIMYQPLVLLHMDGDITPLLAQSWEFGVDMQTVTFHIDPEAFWSDGFPVTAQDVEFTYGKVWELGSKQGDDLMDMVESITVVDDKTVRFTLIEPFGAFLQLLSDVVIAPEHYWSEMTTEEIENYANNDPVVSGPFIVTETVEDSHVTYEARPDYWGGTPHIDVLQKKYYSSDEAQLLALKYGEVDTVANFTLVLSPIMLTPNYEIFPINENNTYTLYLNHRVEPFDVLEFRQALNIGIDRQQLIDFAGNGWGWIPNLVQVPSHLVYANRNIEWSYNEYTHSDRIDMANDLLDTIEGMSTIEDGLDSIRIYNGEPLHFELVVPQSWTIYDSISDSIAQIMRDDCLEMGIDLTIESKTVTALYGLVYKQYPPTPEWDCMIWGRPSKPSYDYFADHWDYTEGDWSSQGLYLGWRNEDIQDNLTALQSLPEGDSERDALIQFTQLEMAAELPCICLYNELAAGVYRDDNFTGWIEDSGLWINGYIPSMVSHENLLSVQSTN